MKLQISNRRLSVEIGFAKVVLMAMTICPTSLALQTDEFQIAVPVFRIENFQSPAATDVAVPSKSPAGDQLVDTRRREEELPRISGQWAQLHLHDGSVIGGEIQAESIDVKTAYGMLTVPISRIVQFCPGLNSSVQLYERIEKLVHDLGGPVASERDSAQRELILIGPKIQKILQQLGDGGNEERRKRLSEISLRFDETIEDAAEEMIDLERTMIFDDTVVTPDFSIVGEIQQKEFAVKSKFGALNVPLCDIKLANRDVKKGKPEIRKSVEVPAMAFFQTQPKSTGVRVNRGDKIVIRADGVVNWTNWNSSSTPEGLTNRSSWNGIQSGKLTARIGSDNSKCIAIGSRGEFVAKSNGVLYLGISMKDSYATNSGYTWTGQYKAKIIVNPKRK